MEQALLVWQVADLVFGGIAGVLTFLLILARRSRIAWQELANDRLIDSVQAREDYSYLISIYNMRAARIEQLEDRVKHFEMMEASREDCGDAPVIAPEELIW